MLQKPLFKNHQRFRFPLVFSLAFFFVLPASTNYKLDSFEFSSGGLPQQSANYRMEGVAGQNADSQVKSANFAVGSGLQFEQQANVPPAPTFTNDTGNRYNKLRYTLNTGDNPSDTVFSIAISTDNFVTTNYIQLDGTIGVSPIYQTYVSWGGASGGDVIGLARNTTFKVKADARQGEYTASAYGPEASAATIDVTLSFDIDVSATNQSTNPPYTVALAELTAGTVTTATDKVWLSLTTNAEAGGFVYVYDENAGLRSSVNNYTIAAVSNNLTSIDEGYGLQADSVTQSSGGPFTRVAPYNGSSQNVGLVDTTIRQILSTANAPITSGRASIVIKAKSKVTTPPSSDYTDTVTFIASSGF
jgi:hypothetical protein